MATKILFAPRQSDAVMEIARSLTPAGFELLIADFGTPEFYRRRPEAEYYLGLARQMGGEFFRSAPKLQAGAAASARATTGSTSRRRARPECRCPTTAGPTAIAVAEHTIMLMLAVLKRVVRFHNDVIAGKWRVGGLRRASGSTSWRASTLGIVGLGNIGKKVARRAAAFDMNVQYYDIARLTEDAGGRARRPLRAAARAAAHLRHGEPARAARRRSPATCSARASSRMMKPAAILINTCRGPVVDEDALYTALKSGQDRGGRPRRAGGGAAQRRTTRCSRCRT